jgi:circadian clock protein KaiC
MAVATAPREAGDTRRAPDLRPHLPKAETGIRGLDEITGGGLPRRRATLVCGSAGTGKTLFAMEFLVRGATLHDEPGVFVCFEEREDDLVQNVISLGFDVAELQRTGQLAIEEVHLDAGAMVEGGPFDLDGLFLRLGAAIDEIGAKRIAFDTLEVLFGTLPNQATVRSELKRLFEWLKAKGVTAVVTAERGDGELTRYGLEEYIADCVLILSHAVHDLHSTRLLQIVKYRGSRHGTDQYPYLIDSDGIAVLPITSLELAHQAYEERVPSGVARLDTMLGGGFYRGSSILMTGGTGTAKSSLAASFVDAACSSGERAVLVSFEESPAYVYRNMSSIGIDLERHVASGHLRIHAARASFHNLERHVVTIQEMVRSTGASAVVIDPITDLWSIGTFVQVRSAAIRLVDYFKSRGITALLTAIGEISIHHDPADTGITSLMDVSIGLVTVELGGERNRCLAVLKARGTAHSNQYREFEVTSHGVQILDAYVGTGEVLTGSARLSQYAHDREAVEAGHIEMQKRRLELQLKQQLTAVKMEAVRVEMANLEAELGVFGREEQRATAAGIGDLGAMARMRHADAKPPAEPATDSGTREG